jgi:hypothetical protein
VVAVVLLALMLLGLAGAALFLVPREARIENSTPPPHAPYSGGLLGRWVALRGGFTGVEARTSIDAPLTARWPSGAVVELSLLEGERYQLIQVVASSGVIVDKRLAREEGTFRHDGAAGTLTLLPATRTLVRRLNADQTATTDSRPAVRRYTVGTQPLLTLSGPCVPGVELGDCNWTFDRAP